MADWSYEVYEEAEKSRKLQEKMLEQQKQFLEQQKKLIEAFNTVATELRLLREDLAPKKLDKSRNQFPHKDAGE